MVVAFDGLFVLVWSKGWFSFSSWHFYRSMVFLMFFRLLAGDGFGSKDIKMSRNSQELGIELASQMPRKSNTSWLM